MKFITTSKSVVAARILAINGFLEYTIELKIILKRKNTLRTATGIKIPHVWVSL